MGFDQPQALRVQMVLLDLQKQFLRNPIEDGETELVVPFF